MIILRNISIKKNAICIAAALFGERAVLPISPRLVLNSLRRNENFDRFEKI